MKKIPTMKKIIVKKGIIALLTLSASQFVNAVCSSAVTLDTPSDRFIDNIDGTVSDTKTGLMWERCQAGYSFFDNGTPSDRSDDTCTLGGSADYNWEDTFNAQSSYAAHTDWRVPNLKELDSIVERGCSSPSWNTNLFPYTAGSVDKAFWTSSHVTSSVGPDYGKVWVVDFSTGLVKKNSSKADTLFLRRVRDH